MVNSKFHKIKYFYPLLKEFDVMQYCYIMLYFSANKKKKEKMSSCMLSVSEAKEVVSGKLTREEDGIII